MSTITNPSKPYTFTNGTVGEAPEVNSDFDIIYAKALEIIAALNDMDAANITVGTLALARIPTTLTGKDADTVDTFHASQTPGASKIPVFDANTVLLTGANSRGPVLKAGGTGDSVVQIPSGSTFLEVRNVADTTSLFKIPENGAAPTFQGNTIWNSGNDGSGSGLDADTIDGFHASSFTNAQLISVGVSIPAPVDGTTYFANGHFFNPTTNALPNIKILKAGTIQAASISWWSSATSSESISIYIRKNDVTDYLIATVSDTSGFKFFINLALDIAVAQGDAICLKIVCPTWATNPTNAYFDGSILIG